MNEREKLIELLKKVDQTVSKEIANWEVATVEEMYGSTADHLLANGVTVQRWIPVTERLPEDDLPQGTKRKMIRCLVYTNKGTVKPCVRQRWEHFNGEMQPWMWSKDLFATPTHWMPPPKPPKEEE